MSESPEVAAPRRWFGEPPDDAYTDADLERLYRMMALMRRFDETVSEIWQKRLIPGPTHAYIGMEAGGCGLIEELPREGFMYSYYRGHGHALARGLDPERVMAEILGRATGICGGKGGSHHLTDISFNHMGANGIVGAGLPQAVGSVLATRLAGAEQPALTFFGDGASSAGAVHEAMNLASVWNLPVVFVCENNGHAVSTRASAMVAIEDIGARAAAYSMPGHVVDGQDVIAVNLATREAFGHAAATGGPSLIELKTYRYRTHSAANPVEYRTEEELAPWQERDPLAILRGRIERRGAAAELFERAAAAAAETVERSLQFALDSPEPALDTALEDVYA